MGDRRACVVGGGAALGPSRPRLLDVRSTAARTRWRDAEDHRGRGEKFESALGGGRRRSRSAPIPAPGRARKPSVRPGAGPFLLPRWGRIRKGGLPLIVRAAPFSCREFRPCHHAPGEAASLPSLIVSTPEHRKLVAAGLSPNVGRALALVREFRGFTQAELACRAGVGKGQQSRYESGRELPKLDSLSRLLTTLGIGFLELFYIVRLLDHLESDLGSEAGVPSEFLMLRDAQFLDSEVRDTFRGLLDQALTLFKLLIKVQVGRDVS